MLYFTGDQGSHCCGTIPFSSRAYMAILLLIDPWSSALDPAVKYCYVEWQRCGWHIGYVIVTSVGGVKTFHYKR